ncbi:hypothetical protein G9A89_009834 [Geosiphon pyriformis]|nr:hypothetical protein G9A89_009834 [Geosiphon pyriformis]
MDKEQVVDVLPIVMDALLKISMVIGPVVGYFDQIAQIRSVESSAGFSLDTCGVLLISRFASLLEQAWRKIRYYSSSSKLTHDHSAVNSPLRMCKISFSDVTITESTMVLELALGIESTVPMPQAWQNFQLQSVTGFRLIQNLLLRLYKVTTSIYPMWDRTTNGGFHHCDTIFLLQYEIEGYVGVRHFALARAIATVPKL